MEDGPLTSVMVPRGMPPPKHGVHLRHAARKDLRRLFDLERERGGHTLG